MENVNIETATATESRPDFSADAAAMHAAAAWLAARIVDKRQTVPALASIHIEATPDGRAILTATDLETWASVTVAAYVDTPGTFATLAKPLADTLAKAKKSGAGAMVRIDATGERPALSCGRARNTLKPVNAGGGLRDLNSEMVATLSGEFSAAWFLADLAAMAPAIPSESPCGAPPAGVMLETRQLAGRNRFVMAASNGQVMAVASRSAPDGLACLPPAVLPGRAAEALTKAGKLFGGADVLTLATGTLGEGVKPRLVVDCGPVRLVAVDLAEHGGLDWQRPFASPAFAPTGETEPCLFPDLLPGSPTAAMESIGKAAPGALAWEPTQGGILGTVAGDPDIVYAVARGHLSYTGRKGFAFGVDDSEARAYLEALASARGLPSMADMEAACEAINAEWGDKAALSSQQHIDIGNGRAPWGEAGTDRYIGNTATGLKNGLQTVKGRVVGYTVAGAHVRRSYSETVQDWENLCEREVYHDGGIEPVAGSYSILMPADGPQPFATAPHYVDAADGRRYLVADNDSKIHLSKEQLRALIGESCFEVMEVPQAGGKPLYILQWLYDDGATRFLCVRPDGRCYGENGPRVYLTREQVDAALAGEPIGETEPAVTDADPMPVEVPTVEMEAPEPAHGPQERESEPEAAQVAPEPENAPYGPETGKTGQSEPTGDPVAAIRARMAEIEALLATLPAETDRGAIGAIQRPKRTPAHERAIRRAWAERKLRRESAHWARHWHKAYEGEQFKTQAAQSQLAALNRDWAITNRRLGEHIKDGERQTAKRRRAVLLARTLQKRLNAEFRLVDRNAARMREAESRAALQEARANVLAAQLAKAGDDIGKLQLRAVNAESENAELWQQIEALTRPVAA